MGTRTKNVHLQSRLSVSIVFALYYTIYKYINTYIHTYICISVPEAVGHIYNQALVS